MIRLKSNTSRKKEEENCHDESSDEETSIMNTDDILVDE